MKLKPLEQWICDNCGKIIMKPNQGFVEWLESSATKANSFHIVHHAPHSPISNPEDLRMSNCYIHNNKPGRRDLSLDEFVNGKGIVHITSFIDIGSYHESEYKGVNFQDGREFAELIRRLYLPYYEEARLYWNKAIGGGFFDGTNEIAIYLPDRLKSLVDQYGD